MPQYMKTTGCLVTVKPKKESAANQGRMLLDDALIEMLDIMLPISSMKIFASDETDAWIAKMAEYNQEWVEPDGRLLKVSDYPDLFNLIGYNYGWSNTNPNGTYTYSFTDVNGVARSLQIYNDLEIDGNATPVEGTPAYFRIPNLAGRFLRCAGTATYVNKWTDSDNVTRHILTEYSAPMYKGQLDAQRDITGRFSCSIGPNFEAYAEGSFRGVRLTEVGTGRYGTDGDVVYGHTMLGSRCVPRQNENIPVSTHVSMLIRLL